MSHRKRVRSRRLRRIWFVALAVSAACLGATLALLAAGWGRAARTEPGREVLYQTPEELLLLYMRKVQQGQYEEMYEQLSLQSRQLTSREAFVERNKKIYEGIGASALEVTVTGTVSHGDASVTVTYDTQMDTVAGEIAFSNSATFIKVEDRAPGDYPYMLVWDHSLIFPELTGTDKVQVKRDSAVRGRITDRNGALLAREGTASSVGVVPGKMRFFAEGGSHFPASGSEAGDLGQDPSVQALSELLGISAESIVRALSAGWVKADSFVPLKTIEKLQEVELLAESPPQEILQEKERRDALLAIPGVMITDTEIREYPLGPAASHLIGYIGEVTAEDLEANPDGGYKTGSKIGKSGLEALYERELKGQDGCKISIVKDNGREKCVLAQIPRQDGATLRLAIDAGLQKTIYEAYAQEESCTVAMNPYTGEILALVSTPAYDSMDFIYGMSQEQWDRLSQDEKLPLYNRFRQALCPGSSFKPIIAAVGLETGAIDARTDYGSGGLEWQKDASWGNYFVTTLHAANPATLENALICSDNVYFARAALRIGREALENELEELGFGQPLPFEISVAQSQYSNGEKIETEIQLADSGYGQGEILVNPIHLAALYTGFANHGDVLKPQLLWQADPQPQLWMEQAWSPDTADWIREALIQAVRSPEGTGRGAWREDVILAGKTGTAELKQSKDDTSGTELGWFNVFTAQEDLERPILLVSMVEDVKGRGGSGYVVQKNAAVLDSWLNSP